MATRTSSTRDGGGHDPQGVLWEPQGRWGPGREIARDKNAVAECVELFSGHYGTWGPRGPNPGGPIRISPEQFIELIDNDAAWVARAYVDETLIGYCVGIRTEIPERGRIAWVSQLVVHSDYRNQRVATTLLYSIWQFSDCYAWGLATANPYAIRALETATRRPCDASEIRKHGAEVLGPVGEYVPYLPTALTVDEDGNTQPRLDTRFFVDHQGIAGLRRKAARKSRPWRLGGLEEGQEWFGCTFHEQVPDALDDEHLANLLTGADGIWIQAYEGMTLDDAHAWHRHAEEEVNAVLDLTGVEPGAAVLDVGCGDGRHVGILGERGYPAWGVDISQRLIERARERATSVDVQFSAADARRHLPDKVFDLAISLYDVVGSSASEDDDLVLLRNVAGHIREGGYLVLGVMNEAITLDRLPEGQRPTSHPEFIKALERLPASQTMETTGSVFNPSLVLYYQGIHYRKEQFQAAHWRLPSEVVVRDRRFSQQSVTRTVERAGFEVLTVRPVQSGRWSVEPILDEHDQRAKELLVLARRPQQAT